MKQAVTDPLVQLCYVAISIIKSVLELNRCQKWNERGKMCKTARFEPLMFGSKV